MIFNPGLVPQSSGGGGVVVGMYTGDGTSEQTITLDTDANIAMVIVCGKGVGSLISSDMSGSSAMIITGSSFVATGANSSGLNYKNRQYRYVAFLK